MLDVVNEPVDFSSVCSPDELMWPPPFQETMEETFRKMAFFKHLNESNVKNYVDHFFRVFAWDHWDFNDYSTKVGKAAKREKLIQRLDHMCYSYSETDTTAALRKNLETNLRKNHDSHEFIKRKLNNDLQMKVYRSMRGDLPDYLCKRPALLRQKLAEACFEKEPETPLGCMYDNIEMVAKETYKLVKENGLEPVTDNWNVVVSEDISMDELTVQCKKLGLTVPKDPDYNRLKEKLKTVLKEKHPIRKFVLDLQNHKDVHEVALMAQYLKNRDQRLNFRTFRQQAKVISDWSIKTNPEAPFNALYELWQDVKDLEVRRQQDYKLTLSSASKAEIISKLNELKVQFHPDDAKENLHEALTKQEIQEHPVSQHLNAMRRQDLVKMSQTLKIQKCHRMNADGLRTVIAAKIFNDGPQAPLEEFKKVQNAMTHSTNASDGWRGVRLVNVAKTAYLNSALNGILSIKSIRNGLETMEDGDELIAGTNCF